MVAAQEVGAEVEARYLNRELSRLDFDSRVLAIAEDPSWPVLDRLRFLTIFSTNEDDFFQVRVAGLKEQEQAGADPTAEGDKSPAQQLRAIRARVETLVERQERVLHDELLPALEEAGIRVRDVSDLAEAEREQVREYFHEKVFPVLTPLAVDPSHPFPYMSHLSLNLAITIRNPETGVQRFARVKVPELLPRLVSLQDGSYILLEQLIEMHLDELFPGMEIVEYSPFRITRDNDLDVDNNGAEDLLATVQSELLRQRRGAFAVRLEVTPEMPVRTREFLCRELELDPDQDVYVRRGPLDLSGFAQLCDLDRRDLKLPGWAPVVPRELRGINGSGFFSLLRSGDFLVEHPYDSFQASVESFVRHAANDPWVLAIKQTLYRTSSSSPIALALERAAAAGKQVAALVEVKARGDEQANIDWAQRLEKAGVHVVYGLVGLKTHAKLVLVVRQEPDGIRRYVHIATGNYNPKTATIYEDIGLLSSDPDLGADVSELFNVLTGYSRQTEYRKLMVAPTTLRKGILRLIDEEARSGDGRIVLKTNNLVDPEIIDHLYDASQKGVQIDLLVRSICCLRPGVPGLSENIRVRSLVGRFLQHSRIYRFGNESRGIRYYIGSADLMERNLDRRVEAVTPVKDPALRKRLDEVLELELHDDVLAWTLVDSTWTKVPTEHGLNAQERLSQLATERAGRSLTSGA